MSAEIKMLDAGDADVLGNVAPGVFDDPIDDRGAKEFLDDRRHHLAVAVDDGLVVGFVSAVHYAHPDKRYPEMWINEVQVAPTHRRKGIARALLDQILHRARELQCTEAWVLADRGNVPATRLYSAAGGTGTPDGALMFTFDLGETE
jgi:GNAT superfamily N-acetyltransferase